MVNRLPEEQLTKLLPALKPMADLVGEGIIPDRSALKTILLGIGLNKLDKEEWALEELTRWCTILVQAQSDPKSSDKTALIAELQERGIQEFPAILAVDLATSGKPLSVKPQSIDFGSLWPKESPSETLEISGGNLKRVGNKSNRLKITQHDSSSGKTLIKVMLLDGRAGELLKDTIIIEGYKEKLEIPVRARWVRVKECACCHEVSLMWNNRDKICECLNRKCLARGPSPSKLVGRLCK